MKKNGMSSKVVEYAVKCLQVVVACFERVIKYISKLAFI